MKMKENLTRVYRTLIEDEDLLRLLYYKPVNQLDDPLSDDKDNVTDMPTDDRWKIIDDVVKKTAKIQDLDSDRKMRVLVYLSRRVPEGGNFWVSNQNLVIDVVVHTDFDGMDFRMSWICDRINEILFNNHVAGTGKLKFVTGDNISTPDDYVGYRLVYSFSNIN